MEIALNKFKCGGIKMAVLSFFVPLFGWIFGGIKKRTNPELGSKCIKSAWIGFGVGIVLSIIGQIAGR